MLEPPNFPPSRQIKHCLHEYSQTHYHWSAGSHKTRVHQCDTYMNGKLHVILIIWHKQNLVRSIRKSWICFYHTLHLTIGQCQCLWISPQTAVAIVTLQWLVTGVSRQPVLDCGTVFHPDCGGRDFPSIPSDDLWKHISLATEAPSDSFDF